jgi:hypothetical protein
MSADHLSSGFANLPLVARVAIILLALGFSVLASSRLDRILARWSLRRSSVSDPARSYEEMDAYWSKRASAEEAARAQLWQRAQTDGSAARELRKRLRADLKMYKMARKRFADSNRETPGFQEQLAKHEQQSADDILKLDTLMRSLGK